MPALKSVALWRGSDIRPSSLGPDATVRSRGRGGFAAMLGSVEGPMTVIVQVQLPDDLKSAIDRRVAEGRAASDADFLCEAARRYAEDLDEDLWTIARAGIADAEAGW
jgi:predicted transcriptional regulator